MNNHCIYVRATNHSKSILRKINGLLLNRPKLFNLLQDEECRSYLSSACGEIGISESLPYYTFETGDGELKFFRDSQSSIDAIDGDDYDSVKLITTKEFRKFKNYLEEVSRS